MTLTACASAALRSDEEGPRDICLSSAVRGDVNFNRPGFTDRSRSVDNSVAANGSTRPLQGFSIIIATTRQLISTIAAPIAAVPAGTTARLCFGCERVRERVSERFASSRRQCGPLPRPPPPRHAPAAILAGAPPTHLPLRALLPIPFTGSFHSCRLEILSPRPSNPEKVRK
jgi:hypothetical protein